MSATVQFYDNFGLIEDEAVLRTASAKVTLHDSSYVFDSTDQVYADLSHELSTANGYTNGGLALASKTWARSGAIATYDAGDSVWNVTTANLVARWAILRLVGTINSLVDPLVLAILMSATPSPADVTIAPGNPLTIRWNSLGIFTKQYA